MDMGRIAVSISVCVLALVAGFTGCTRKPEAAGDTYTAAKALFEHTSKHFHIASAEVNGMEKTGLQKLALSGYEQLVREYPHEDYWVAQALRSLGNIYAAQTNVDAAVKSFLNVEHCCANRDWEVLMSWKSAADLLWDQNRSTEARALYRKIVERFDRPATTQLVATIVRGSKLRLSEGNLAHTS